MAQSRALLTLQTTQVWFLAPMSGRSSGLHRTPQLQRIWCLSWPLWVLHTHTAHNPKKMSVGKKATWPEKENNGGRNWPQTKCVRRAWDRDEGWGDFYPKGQSIRGSDIHLEEVVSDKHRACCRGKVHEIKGEKLLHKKKRERKKSSYIQNLSVMKKNHFPSISGVFKYYKDFFNTSQQRLQITIHSWESKKSGCHVVQREGSVIKRACSVVIWPRVQISKPT